MKKLYSIAFIGLSLSLTASAASEKICFGSGDAKGIRFVLTITKKTAVVSAAQGSNAEGIEGKFQANGEVAGRDGKNYLSYAVSNVEGPTDLLVDSELLHSGTTGLAKVRWRGEGYSQSTYFCRDNQ